jgi:hypothetical protein
MCCGRGSKSRWGYAVGSETGALKHEGLPYRRVGCYIPNCHEDEPQFDDFHHGHAPCCVVCLNAKHQSEPKPPSEGSPSIGRRVSTRLDLSPFAHRYRPAHAGRPLWGPGGPSSGEVQPWCAARLKSRGRKGGR